MQEKFYFISKLTLGENGLIESVYVYEVVNNQITNELGDKNRNWMLATRSNYSLQHYEKREDGKWYFTGNFKYDGSLFSWDKALPKNLARRKTFISYYHEDDQGYREKLEKLYDDLIISKSVNDGDIDSENSDEYIKKLIHDGHLSDTTVLVVLLGSKTKCRKHVDWEISGALDFKVGDKYAGLLGLKLPTHADFGTGRHTHSNLPKRLSENLKSGYARIADWTEDRVEFQNLIEDAFERRENDNLIINRELQQMEENICV